MVLFKVQQLLSKYEYGCVWHCIECSLVHEECRMRGGRIVDEGLARFSTQGLRLRDEPRT